MNPPSRTSRCRVSTVGVGLLAVALAMDAQAAQIEATGDVQSGNYSGSLANERDRTGEWTLEAAQRDFDAGETVSGVRRLQELFERDPALLVLTDGIYRSVADAASRMLLGGQGERRATYERLFEPIAREQLEKAFATGHDAAIADVARVYRLTPAGRDAALYLAAVAADRGDRDAAAQWLYTIESPVREASATAEIFKRLNHLSSATSTDNVTESPQWNEVATPPTSLQNVRWQAKVEMSADARHEISAAVSELDAQAVLPLLSAKPLVHGAVAYARRLGDIVAIDVESGHVIWRRAVPTPVSHLIESGSEFGNSMRRSSSTAIFLERLIRSTLTDNLSTDGTRLFAVIARRSPSQNMLLALNVKDGSLLWQTAQDTRDDPSAEGVASSDSANAHEADPPMDAPEGLLENVFFMGPPQSFGKWRIVPGQLDRTVSLFALDAETGALGWSVPLGRAVRTLKDDKPRHGTACPITIHEGKAYCPTAAGCIACVDLRSRRFLWAFRYPRDDLPKTSRDETRVRPDTTHATHMPTREIWQEVFLKIAGDVLVFASPDSDRLYVLDARSGTPRWNVAREQGIFLAGPVDDRILIMGSHQATARAVADGRRLWTTEIAAPAGTGLVTESAYVFPTQSGGLQSIQWADGASFVHSAVAEEMPVADVSGRRIPIQTGPPSKLRPVRVHNLVGAGDMVLMQSFDRFAAVDPRGSGETRERDAALAATLDDDQTSDTHRFEWPELSFNAMDTDRLRPLAPMLTILQSLRPTIVAAEAVVRSAARLGPHARAPDARAAELTTELASILGREQPSDRITSSAVRIVNQLARQPLDRLYVTLDQPRRSVRLDYWLERGFIETATSHPELQQQFPELVRNHLPTLASRGGHDRDLQSDSSVRTDPRSSAGASGQHWPDGQPTISEHPPRGGNLYVNTVPMTIVSDSPWEHVTVQVDRQEQNLWLYRSDRVAPVSMPLPRSEGGQMSREFLHAWASGPLLCLRVGTDLFGFWLESPEDELPQAPAWPSGRSRMSIAGERPPFMMGLTETSDSPRPLWDASVPGYFDNFSRPFGMVGPVRPSYVCYQERGHLIALDARTGREIWCRSELPVGTFAVGDDDHIVLLRDDASTAEVLRSSDGATIAHWNWTDAVGQDDASPQLFSHLVAVQGTLGLWHSAPPQQMGDNLWLREDGRRAAETTATVLDLSTGRPLWSKTVSADSWIVSIDESLLGNLSPEGKLTLWDWQTGEVVTEHVVQLPSKITGVFVETDAARAYVIVTDRPDDRRLLGELQIRGSDRRPLVNGSMHAIDRATGRHLWEQRLENIGWILDQPRHIPLFVTSYMMRDEEHNRPAGVLKIYDRRTGDLLHEQVRDQSMYLYHALRSDAAGGRIEVETTEKIIRFQFATDAAGKSETPDDR